MGSVGARLEGQVDRPMHEVQRVGQIAEEHEETETNKSGTECLGTDHEVHDDDGGSPASSAGIHHTTSRC